MPATRDLTWYFPDFDDHLTDDSGVTVLEKIGKAFGLVPADRTGTSGAAIRSPWSDGELTALVMQDAFGLDPENLPVNRATAMSVPPVAGGRHRIVGEVAGKPLRVLDGEALTETQPAWLSRTKNGVSPWHRMACTLDDHIFYGWSLWGVERHPWTRTILDAWHIPFGCWRIDTQSDGTPQILVNDQPVAHDAVILFPGPMEGLINTAQRTVRGGVNLEQAWASKVRNPIPNIVVEEVEQGSLKKREVREFLQTISKAMRRPDAAVMFQDARVKFRFEGDVNSDLMIAGRNALRVDIANHLNLSAEQIEGAKHASTLKYETDDSQQTALVDRMSFWTEPIEHRLSMDDVTAPGTRIRFDFGDTHHPTGPTTED